MAARKNKIRHDENTRLKIQTSQLVNRLTDHILGKVELESTQVTAALGLLKKTLPDLSAGSMDLTGDQTVKVISEKPQTNEEWEAAHCVGSTGGAATRTH